MPSLIQPTLFELPDVSTFPSLATVAGAEETLASGSVDQALGAIYTRAEVVEFILDLIGYDVSEPLHRRRILEPSFGRGDFLLPIVERLLAAWRNHGGKTSLAAEELPEAIHGVELHRGAYAVTCGAVIARLLHEGISAIVASELVNRWFVQGDFLLEEPHAGYDFIVGNPPYVRQEMIPPALLAEYRRRYRTMYDRADLYVPFIERSLSLLAQGGTLCFICADRWMKNRYGGPLREFIARGYHLQAYVDMMDTDAFHAEVSAYPAITVITKEKAGATRIARRPQLVPQVLSAVAREIRSEKVVSGSSVREMAGVVNGSEPWLLASTDQLALIRRIESQHPALEQAGCAVGIGVATGADDAFIGDYELLAVESDRKLPLVTTRDIQSGEVVWSGLGVINPFNVNGGLVDLREYPKLARYLEERRDVIAKRHCAQKNPANWYRTIDRIWPALTGKTKLLIPDIKGEAHVVYEPGSLYPHHNLYYVTSVTWDMRALQAVLLSSIAKLFVACYTTKMRGGYLRFQAQYLRRIRVPYWHEVPTNLRQELVQAAISRNVAACNKAAYMLFNLNEDERCLLGGNGEDDGPRFSGI